MSLIGLIGLIAAFVGSLGALGCLGAGHILATAKPKSAARLALFGRLAAVLVFLGLTLAVAVLIFCFLTGDVTLEYVVRNRSSATGDLAWLLKASGLWAGRAGSLLFWAWALSLFNCILVIATARKGERIDNGALAISSVVVLCFVAVLLFVPSSALFTPLDSRYFDSAGRLMPTAAPLGMNTLLEHWAMALHPPMLLLGYAGLTMPFAYGLAALVVNDSSTLWVRRATPYLMVSWLFLSIGIGIGAIWAYVVLGWGGYWGWDPVENAGLLPWLMALALIHSFTLYRREGRFKRWSVFCACLVFIFVAIGGYITRAGAVHSVHGFNEDLASSILFLGLALAAFIAGAVGVILRWKGFSAPPLPSKVQGLSALKDTLYFINNLLLLVFVVLLSYMTVSSALPPFLPLGGVAIPAATYDSIARPLVIAYCALAALCSLVGWRSDGSLGLKRAIVGPGIAAAVVFVFLLVFYGLVLKPGYDSMLVAGGTAANNMVQQGPPLVHDIVALVGFAVASLLLFNGLFMAARAFRRGNGGFFNKLSQVGGGICHGAMGVILVGLIGSSMFALEVNAFLPYNEQTDEAYEVVHVQDYDLVYRGNDITKDPNGVDSDYTLTLDVYRVGPDQTGDEGAYVGTVTPTVQVVAASQQQKLVPGVLSFPLEDLFVVYRGVNADGSFSLEVRVNPLISLLWVGFILLLVGAFVSLFARRRAGKGAGVAAVGVSAEGEAPKAPEQEDAAAAAASESDAVIPILPEEPAVVPLEVEEEGAHLPSATEPSESSVEEGPSEPEPVEVPREAAGEEPGKTQSEALEETAEESLEEVSEEAVDQAAEEAVGEPFVKPEVIAFERALQRAYELEAARKAEADERAREAAQKAEAQRRAQEAAAAADCKVQTEEERAIDEFWAEQPGILFGNPRQRPKRKKGR